MHLHHKSVYIFLWFYFLDCCTIPLMSVDWAVLPLHLRWCLLYERLWCFYSTHSFQESLRAYASHREVSSYTLAPPWAIASCWVPDSDGISVWGSPWEPRPWVRDIHPAILLVCQQTLLYIWWIRLSPQIGLLYYTSGLLCVGKKFWTCFLRDREF